MRKKVDERLRNLIKNGVRMRHRSMFVIIGDKSRDQIVNLYYLLSKAVIKSRPTVLWCYKDKLELSSHKKKCAKQVKKLMQRGLHDPEKVDPFSLFIESGGISYCLYKDSDRILGNTYGMCMVRDFEALTPNILARSIETAEGGGLVVLLLRSLSSLSSLYTMVMVWLEGQISRDSALQCLHKGCLPSGDQIPWKFCEEFEDTGFPSLSGPLFCLKRTCALATFPLYVMASFFHVGQHGYGSAALDRLKRYYEGQLSRISEIDIETKEETTLPEKVTEAAEKVSLLEEKVSPGENLPPLLMHLKERLPEKVDYIGPSFGLNGDLFRFWKKHKLFLFIFVTLRII